MFIGLAIVCDDYFVPALDRIADGKWTAHLLKAYWGLPGASWGPLRRRGGKIHSGPSSGTPSWSGLGGPLGRPGRSKLFTSSFVPGALAFKALYAVVRTGSLSVQSFPRHRS